MYKVLGRNRGFTLIELLVVVAIIGILSSVVLASLNSARQKGRDARRVSDLKQLQLALELYYDANAAYPTFNTDYATSLAGLVSAGYISVLPDDPGTAANAYGYAGGGTTYALGAIMESTGQTTVLANDNDTNIAITINGGATNCNTNAGAAGEAVYCVRP